jgi:hypothetical protein
LWREIYVQLRSAMRPITDLPLTILAVVRSPVMVMLVVLAAASLSACSATTSSTSPVAQDASGATVTSSTSATKSEATHKRRSTRHLTAPKRARRPTGSLVLSSASGRVVQPQPAPGSCHARGSGPNARPDPKCTPGALNPAVTQQTISQTICVSGWTRSVRPSESITEVEKRASMAAYADDGPMGNYEYDHLVPLELGGAVNDSRNLWPEPGGSPNPKDSVENALHRMVCDGDAPLVRVQHIIATSWVTWAKSHGYGSQAASPSTATQRTTSESAPSSGPNKPIADVNCSDFPTHAAAQAWFEQHGGSPSNDVAGLDHDHDGLACESLP